MTLMSPEGYFKLFIENKSEKERKKQIKELEKEIKKLETNISKGKLCLEKPDYKTRLLYCRQYLSYINEQLHQEKPNREFNKDALLEILLIIKNKEAYKYIPPQEINGAITTGWYDYSSKLLECPKIIGADYDYAENFKLIQDKEINELTKEELKTYTTRIFRGDRFCEGLIAKCIDDGTIEKIIKRYLDLC